MASRWVRSAAGCCGSSGPDSSDDSDGVGHVELRLMGGLHGGGEARPLRIVGQPRIDPFGERTPPSPELAVHQAGLDGLRVPKLPLGGSLRVAVPGLDEGLGGEPERVGGDLEPVGDGAEGGFPLSVRGGLR